MKQDIKIAPYVALMFAIYCGLTRAQTNLPEQFLKSEVIVRAGRSDLGGMNVEKYTEQIQHAVLNDGTTPKLLDWTSDGNEYTLRLKMKKNIVTFSFIHDLGLLSKGRYSLLKSVVMGYEEVDPLQFTLLMFSMAPEDPEPKE